METATAPNTATISATHNVIQRARSSFTKSCRFNATPYSLCNRTLVLLLRASCLGLTRARGYRYYRNDGVHQGLDRDTRRAGGRRF